MKEMTDIDLAEVINDVYFSNPILKYLEDEKILYHLIASELSDRGYDGELIDNAWLYWLDEYTG